MSLMTFMDEPSVSGAGGARVMMCVLASGSQANCTAIVFGDPAGALRRVCLIDLGLSPKKTVRLLSEHGLRPDQIDDVILTHLDSDHLHFGWSRPGVLPPHVRVRVHGAHERALAVRCPYLFDCPTGRPVRPFTDGFELGGTAAVRAYLAAHDECGAAAFRFEFAARLGSGTLGFATDLGCITAELIEHLYCVDVLAIESNYCPRMQAESGRPAFLQQRIMGGRGHLSNQQALEAVRHIEPRLHVVLLHLSRQCNTAELAASMHEGADYALTISAQERPTRWVRLSGEVAACAT